MLKPLDVIWIFDELITPPGPKMVVCIEPELGLFFRINEKSWQYGLPIAMADHPDFLTKDSHLECGEPLELDDYIIAGSLKRKGVVGQLARKHAPDICLRVAHAMTISFADKERIRFALGC